MAPPPAEPGAPMPPPADPLTASATAAPATDLLSKEGWSTKIVDRPIGLSEGMLEVDVPVYVNLTKEAVGKPVFVPLVAYFGVTNEFQLSLHHIAGLCVTGKENGCDKAYNDLGLRGTYSLLGRGSSFELAAWAQLHALSFSPDLELAAIVGPFINWVITPNLLLLSNPGLQIGLTERDAGNKESLAVPAYLFLQATDNLAPYLLTGIGGPLDGFGDAHFIPVGLGAFYGINNRVDVVAEFAFTNLLGKGSSADGRTLLLQLNYRPL